MTSDSAYFDASSQVEGAGQHPEIAGLGTPLPVRLAQSPQFPGALPLTPSPPSRHTNALEHSRKASPASSEYYEILSFTSAQPRSSVGPASVFHPEVDEVDGDDHASENLQDEEAVIGGTGGQEENENNGVDEAEGADTVSHSDNDHGSDVSMASA